MLRRCDYTIDNLGKYFVHTFCRSFHSHKNVHVYVHRTDHVSFLPNVAKWMGILFWDTILLMYGNWMFLAYPLVLIAVPSMNFRVFVYGSRIHWTHEGGVFKQSFLFGFRDTHFLIQRFICSHLHLQSFAITIYLNSINFPGSPSQIFFPFVKLWQIGYNRPKFPVLIKISFKKLMRLLHRFHHGKWKIVGKMIRLILWQLDVVVCSQIHPIVFWL